MLLEKPYTIPAVGCKQGPKRGLAASGEQCQHDVFIENKSVFGMIRSYGLYTGVSIPATETERMLKGYGLTTAELYYRLPDYRNVLNSFIWQDYDLAPDYPERFRFIEFWQSSIEGPLHSIRFTHRKLIAPGEWRSVVGEFRLH